MYMSQRIKIVRGLAIVTLMSVSATVLASADSGESTARDRGDSAARDGRVPPIGPDSEFAT